MTVDDHESTSGIKRSAKTAAWLMIGSLLAVGITLALAVRHDARRQIPSPARRESMPTIAVRADSNSEASAVGSPVSTDLPNPLTEGAVLTVEIDSSLGAASPAVTGTTNLPDGAEFLISLRPPDESELYQDKAVVRGGRFRGGPFAGRKGLAVGSYTVEVHFSSIAQDSSVKVVIGKSGQRLTGKLVKYNKDFEMRYLNVSKEFIVGGPTGTAEGLRRALAAQHEAEAVHRETDALVARGRAMEPLRVGSDLGTMRKCVRTMRQYMPKAESLYARAERLPTSYQMAVFEAGSLVRLCVTCSEDALAMCKLTSERLREGQGALRATKARLR